jgi:hypothetical protein
MANLDAIHDQLAVASSLLDAVANDIRDLGFTPDEHIRRIGHALGLISEIQHAIYRTRPDLTPAFLRDPEGVSAHAEANGRLTQALAKVYRFGEAGQGAEAERELRAYIARESSALHRRLAEHVLQRSVGADGT